MFVNQFSFSQELKFKEKININISSCANKDFQVVYVGNDTNKMHIKTNIVYDACGDTLSYQIVKKTNWNNADTLNYENAKEIGFTDFNLDGEILPKDDRLIIYFHPMTDTIKNAKINTFFKENDFSIKLEPRVNLDFGYKRFHMGVLTLPMKIYLSSNFGENYNNIATDINVGLYFGCFFGNKNFVKLPAEKEYRVYESGYSINAFAGLNKLDMNEKNSSDTTFAGSILST